MYMIYLTPSNSWCHLTKQLPWWWQLMRMRRQQASPHNHLLDRLVLEAVCDSLPPQELCKYRMLSQELPPYWLPGRRVGGGHLISENHTIHPGIVILDHLHLEPLKITLRHGMHHLRGWTVKSMVMCILSHHWKHNKPILLLPKSGFFVWKSLIMHNVTHVHVQMNKYTRYQYTSGNLFQKCLWLPLG